MNIKRFQSVSRLLSKILLAVGSIPIVSLMIFGIGYFFLRDYSIDINFSSGQYTMFTASKSWTADVLSLQSQERLVEWWLATGVAIIYLYSCFRGSLLFRQLSLGETPFTPQFVKSLKTISFLLIGCDIGVHVLYALAMTLILMFNGGGYHLEIGIGNPLIAGLVIYCIAGVINYGIELQRLSDDVV